MKRSAAKDGALFENWVWWPHTLNAHCLIAHSKTLGKENETLEALFLSLYENGKNPSTTGVVIEIGKSIGIDVTEEQLAGYTDGVFNLLQTS
jgi:predicted DsbA family dithiol-disulfide isomerase